MTGQPAAPQCETEPALPDDWSQVPDDDYNMPNLGTNSSLKIIKLTVQIFQC